jgi:DNA processing protein
MSAVETRNAAGLLTLMALRGVGPATAERLAETFVTFDALLHAEPIKLRAVVSAAVAQTLVQNAILTDARLQADCVLDKASRLGVKVVSVFDKDYPAALRTIPDRPTVIYIKGRAPMERSVACIGTREPSEFGITVTERLVEKLVASSWGIVSGLAVGVDTLSHTAALRYGGRTIAVMAGGLDGIYPKQNAKLADEIIERDGALISEQPFGVPPAPRNLVQRDRLQSGLSVATFVMQTDIKGGSMHTVRFTLMQGRLLFAPVPQGRHAEEPKSRGIVALTQMAANRFADTVQAEGDFRRLLSSTFGSRPVAIPLASREDYASMLDRLEQRLVSGPDLHERRSIREHAQPSMI